MVTLLTEEQGEDVLVSKRRRLCENDEHDNTMINPVQRFFGECMVAPDFNCASIYHNQISRIQLSTLLGQYKAVALFFYEGDFTPSASKDLMSINHHVARFESLNTIPLAMSADTEMVHSAYIHSELGFTPSFPLVADTTRSVSRHFNTIHPSTGFTHRAVFIIDRTRKIRFSFVIEDSRIMHSMDTICSFLLTF
ncbi:hypothetical protein RMATCC62417_11061 [Rhizopus microsporus]|nr:hypothetical protein RMATCC62417_11061 [Rhizopus microsporus]